jgi:hypothetical protein
LFGALYGIDDIPMQWQSSVLTCESSIANTQKPRPSIYWPNDILKIAEELLLI